MFIGLLDLDRKSELQEYLELLRELSLVENVNYDDVRQTRSVQTKNMQVYVGVVDNSLVVCGTLLIIPRLNKPNIKFGQIEDLVVNPEYRDKGYGKRMVQFLTEKARCDGCYKIVLNSNKENKEFYDKCGFMQNEIQMRIDL